MAIKKEDEMKELNITQLQFGTLIFLSSSKVFTFPQIINIHSKTFWVHLAFVSLLSIYLRPLSSETKKST